MKRLVIFALALLAVLVIAVSSWPRKQQESATSTKEAVATQSALAQATVAPHNHKSTARIPAHYDNEPALSALAPTLEPAAFDGNIRLAYQAAKDIPQTLAQLPCYCHCDMSRAHKSLHSCFEDEHGANCGICIGSAIMARNLQRQGLSASQIREQIMKAYGSAGSDQTNDH